MSVKKTTRSLSARIKTINVLEKSKEHEVDLSHIKDEKIKSTVREMIANYSPKIPKRSCIEMKICLTDEVPVYEKPRRLAPKEKEIVSQIVQGRNLSNK